jgi:uncharacterized protein YbjT (DUF2867 family)
MNNEGSTILVTGATGTVGSEVVRQLSTKGQIIIRAAARSANNPTFKNLKSVELVQLDYNKPETLATSFKDVNKLFLLTPFQSDMLDLTSNLVNAAKKSGVKYIIKQSVMGALWEPGITPGRLHRQAEKIIVESGIPFSFLQNRFLRLPSEDETILTVRVYRTLICFSIIPYEITLPVYQFFQY